MSALACDCGALIERRPGIRQLRIGVGTIELVLHDDPGPASATITRR